MKTELNIIKPILIQWAIAYVLIAIIAINILYLAQTPQTSSNKLQKIKPITSIKKQTRAQIAANYSGGTLATIDTKSPEAKKPKPRKSTTPSTAGNGYSWGQCTWYAKNKRSDLPNNLGDAHSWAASARSQGIPTGSEPKIGAIGQQGMHVVYVEAVNDNGTVSISEMNYHGVGVVSQRTVPASDFEYIY